MSIIIKMKQLKFTFHLNNHCINLKTNQGKVVFRIDS